MTQFEICHKHLRGIFGPLSIAFAGCILASKFSRRIPCTRHLQISVLALIDLNTASPGRVDSLREEFDAMAGISMTLVLETIVSPTKTSYRAHITFAAEMSHRTKRQGQFLKGIWFLREDETCFRREGVNCPFASGQIQFKVFFVTTDNIKKYILLLQPLSSDRSRTL